MCPACADKVLLWHFRAWAESDPWSHLSSVQRSFIIPASGSLYSGEPVGCSCLFPTLRKKELPSVTHQRQRPAQCTGRAFFMQMNGANCASRLSSKDNPSQGTTFSCASTGRRQLCPTATPLSWDVCSPL